MPLVPWTALGEMYDRIALGRVRLVGWGAGGSFKAAYSACPLRLAYLVDSDPAKWGTTVWGVEVRPPDALLGEDPAGVAVVIYSAFLFGAEILAALDTLGPFPALWPYAPHIAGRFVDALRRGIDPAMTRKPPARGAGTGIVVQGPVVDGVTETVLRYHAATAPDSHLVLSTWSTTPPDLLDRMERWCDRVVVSDPPAVPGPQNRNLQTASTAAGLAALAEAGVDKALKTRTDTLAAAPDLLERGAALQAAHPVRFPGTANRLVISERFTFRYLPYTMSDIVMFGDVADLAAYWSAPLDGRSFSPYTPDWRATSYRAFSQARGTPEIHYLTSYCRRQGHEPAWTVDDHWTILRDLFVVVDEGWFGLFFPKYGFDDLRRYGTGPTPAAVVDRNLWDRLAAGSAAAWAEAALVDIDATTFDAMVAVPPGTWAAVEAGLSKT